MSDLPRGWAATALHECCDVVSGQSPPGETYNEVGQGLPFYQGKAEFGQLYPSPRKWCTEPSKIAEQGDVLISVRAPVGPTNLAPGKSCIGRGLAALRPRPGVLTKFVLYQMRATEKYLADVATGSTFSAISSQQLKEHRFLIAPTEEQDRIVAEIEKQFTRLDAATAALKRVQANLKRYRASVLKSACEGCLVPTEAEVARQEGRDYEPASELLKRILRERRARWEADTLAKMIASGKRPTDDRWKQKYKEPAAANTSGLPDLPGGWCWATVESLSTKVVDGVHKKPNYVSEGIPFVTVRNLTAGPGISFDRISYVSADDHAEFIKRANPEEGDLLVSKDGTLGTIRAIRTDRTFSIFVSVAMIKPVLHQMSDYLEIALMSPQVQIQMVPKGSGLQHIHLEDLREDCIPLAPLPEQQRIAIECARKLSVLDNLEEQLNGLMIRGAALRSAVLAAAFSGRLVPREPTDEPASALLERIRAARTGAPIRHKMPRGKEPAYA